MLVTVVDAEVNGGRAPCVVAVVDAVRELDLEELGSVVIWRLVITTPQYSFKSIQAKVQR